MRVGNVAMCSRGDVVRLNGSIETAQPVLFSACPDPVSGGPPDPGQGPESPDTRIRHACRTHRSGAGVFA